MVNMVNRSNEKLTSSTCDFEFNKYLKAQEKGGIASLYYKHEGKQMFQRTFGLPILIGFVIGLGLMLFGFSRL